MQLLFMFSSTKCYMWETHEICSIVPILQAVISLCIQIPRWAPNFVFLFSSYSELEISMRAGSVYLRAKLPAQQRCLCSNMEGGCYGLCSNNIEGGCVLMQLY
jgi:hypothetical protein